MMNPPARGKNRLWKWVTGSWTLRPVNTTTDFVETPNWEQLKFRLNDCIYDATYWSEIPGRRNFADRPYDYFFDMRVPGDKLPLFSPSDVPTEGIFMIPQLAQIAHNAIALTANLQTDYGVTVMKSKAVFPENTGYMLRFLVQAPASSRQGALFEFYFGDFGLRLDSTGVAWLYQTPDNGVSWANVAQFRWSPVEATHRMHEIMIVPHHRNRIEFVCAHGDTRRNMILKSNGPQVVSAYTGDIDDSNYVYVIPGEPVPNPGGRMFQDRFLITKPGPWALRVARAFRPFIQVSRVGFYNSTDEHKEGFDAPTVMEFPPTKQPEANVHIDLNGGEIEWNLLDYPMQSADPGRPFTADGRSNAPQFHFKLQGQNNIVCTGGLAAQNTPEFYGYTIEKSAIYEVEERDTVLTPVKSLQITSAGGSPELQNLVIHLDASRNEELDRFKERAHIPLEVIDKGTGVVLFSGTSYQVHHWEAPAQRPEEIVLEAKGMVDRLMRVYPIQLDFTQDPKRDDALAWPWDDALDRCFLAAGFDITSEVVIEDRARYSFRLWNDGDTGGTRGGNGRSGNPSATGTRWMPNPSAPIYQFIDYLIKDVLGWNWWWNLQARRWEIYKRPRPEEIAALPTVCGFYKNRESMDAAVGPWPKYLHSKRRNRITRPECTTVWGFTYMTGQQIANKAGLDAFLERAKADPDFEDHANMFGQRFVGAQLENPNGFKSPLHPDADESNLDYIGSLVPRVFNFTQAAGRDPFEWMLRRAYEDMTHGYKWTEFEADWGDLTTASLRKWRKIDVDGVPYLIHAIDPSWSHDRMRRASYMATKARPDEAPPPR
jgi:hypothetical protein